VAAELLDGSGEGVWLIELASLSNPEFVVQEVASVLGVRDEGGRPAVDVLSEAIPGRHLLIVLDKRRAPDRGSCQARGCSAPLLSEARRARHQPRAAPIDGEHVYRVPPLSVPAPGDAVVEEVARSNAVRLPDRHPSGIAVQFECVLDLCLHLASDVV
jgi:predicted ATPase